MLDCSAKNSIPTADIARFEVSVAIAVLVNTAPAAFWILSYLYAHTGVCRREVQEITSTTITDGRALSRGHFVSRV